MPKSISPTKFRNGLLRPTVSSELKRVSCAFQPRTNFAMLHRGRLQGRSGFFGENPSTTDSVPSHFSKTINPCPSVSCARPTSKNEERPADGRPPTHEQNRGGA